VWWRGNREMNKEDIIRRLLNVLFIDSDDRVDSIKLTLLFIRQIKYITSKIWKSICRIEIMVT
jgi:hypothetical protein